MPALPASDWSVVRIYLPLVLLVLLRVRLQPASLRLHHLFGFGTGGPAKRSRTLIPVAGTNRGRGERMYP
eukprot:2164751-Pyramimonas_sp.AAC.1